SDHEHDNDDLRCNGRQLDDRGWEEATDLGDATNDPRSLPTVKGTQGQVPAKRHAGTVGQRGALHVQSQDAVLMRSLMTLRRRVSQTPFGEQSEAVPGRAGTPEVSSRRYPPGRISWKAFPGDNLCNVLSWRASRCSRR